MSFYSPMSCEVSSARMMSSPSRGKIERSLRDLIGQELGDADCLVLGLFLMAYYPGQIVVPDFGFYGRECHISLIRKERLIAGVNFLGD